VTVIDGPRPAFVYRALQDVVSLVFPGYASFESSILRRWPGTTASVRPRSSSAFGSKRFAGGNGTVDYARVGATDRAPTHTSRRNAFPGVITKVTRDKVSALVEIQAGPHRVVSLITREAADELGLKAGLQATGTVKATSVMVEVS
jgi:molybdopterin-binding protein